MDALRIPLRWQLIVGSLVVLFALARPGDPLRDADNALDGSAFANNVSIQEAIALIDAGALVIDVRESPRTHVPGALLIPLETLAAHLSKLEAAKAQTIVVYCGNGTTRGPRAANVLTQAGFTHVVNMAPGIEGWRAAKLPETAS